MSRLIIFALALVAALALVPATSAEPHIGRIATGRSSSFDCQRHYLYFGGMLMTTKNPKLEDLRHALQTVRRFSSGRSQRKLTTDSITEFDSELADLIEHEIGSSRISVSPARNALN